MRTATLWGGDISSEVYNKIVNVMECVHNQPGNYDESEVLEVAKQLQGFTTNDIDEIDQLTIDIREDDEDEDEELVEDTTGIPYADDAVTEVLAILSHD